MDLIYYDNAGDADRAIANADEAAGRKVDLLIEYNPETSANMEIAQRMKAAGIPVLAINYPVGDAPLYTCDHFAAGAIAGRALGAFARDAWPGETPLAVIAGDIGDPGEAVTRRVEGIVDGLHGDLPGAVPAQLDNGGQPRRTESIVAKFLAQYPRRKVVIAALDDATALSARDGVQVAVRSYDCIIAGQGLDRGMHGGASEKKEIDPTNRASVVLGSVAYFMDRYGYDVLPLALRMLNGETPPERTVTKHILVTAKNVFQEYPPTDMN